MKMRVAGSISRATALNSPSPTASQRTDPMKSDVSAAGNASSMSQDVCPLASERLNKRPNPPWRIFPFRKIWLPKKTCCKPLAKSRRALYRQLWLMGVGTMIAILNTMFLSCRIHLLIYLTTY